MGLNIKICCCFHISGNGSLARGYISGIKSFDILKFSIESSLTLRFAKKKSKFRVVPFVSQHASAMATARVWTAACASSVVTSPPAFTVKHACPDTMETQPMVESAKVRIFAPATNWAFWSTIWLSNGEKSTLGNECWGQRGGCTARGEGQDHT